MRTLVTQSRMASLIASFRVRLPESTPDNFRSEQTHAKNIEPLAFHVLSAHINGASEAETGSDGGRCDSMLARAGFRDDALFSHAHGEKALAQSVVYFVRPGVEKIFAL